MRRLLAGSSLGVEVGVLLTDPPYGVGIGEKNRFLDKFDRAGQMLIDLDGDRSLGEVEDLWRSAFPVFARSLGPGAPFYVFGPQGGDLGLLLLSLRDAGLVPRHILIWVKNRPSFSLGRLDYDYQHEPIVYGWRPGGAHPWYASTARSSVLAFDRPSRSPEHATVKPVDLLSELIRNSTRRDDIVFDPFGGSGSSLIAAHQHGRRGFLVEIVPRYVDVICRRFERLTGERPVLERTGEAVSFLNDVVPAGSEVRGSRTAG